MSKPEQLLFVRARRQLLLLAAAAAKLPGLTPTERAQMQTIAGLAGLQLHRVGDRADRNDARKVEDDLRRVKTSFHGLAGAISRTIGVQTKFDSDMEV